MDTPAPCSAIVTALRGAAPPDHAAILRALRKEVDTAGLLELAQFSTDRYVRVPLARGDGWELRLLCWLPGQSSALHGHRGSACAFRVIIGEATECRLDGAVLRHGAGEIATVALDAIHQVGNDTNRPLVTLHLYAPELPVEQPSRLAGWRVVILGGGWNGAALAARLLGADDPALRVTLVERGPRVGRGVAYGTTDPRHLLNVPAGRMSIDPDAPQAFQEYARSRGFDAGPHALLPRALYGDYVEDRLATAIGSSRARLRLARSEAVDVRRLEGGWSVRLADGASLVADEVVLATGHGPARRPRAFAGLRDPRVVEAWQPGAVDDLAPDARVLLVGTGLTALDMLCSLRARGHRRAVTAWSRGGRWPKAHLQSVVWTGERPHLDPLDAPVTADGLVAWFEDALRQGAAQGLPWQAVVGEVREHVATLWRRLAPEERARLLAARRGAWEVLRHRMPWESRASLGAWRAEGWLADGVAEVVRVRVRPDGVVTTSIDATGEREAVWDRVILCTGPESDVTRYGSALWTSLLRRGLVAGDPHGLGVLTTPAGETVDARGAPTGLWATGGLLRPDRFEVTSVPDMAPQIADLARRLLARRTAPQRLEGAAVEAVQLGG
jgi:uncharacterized NAD(P)/FAD-binding protein YdhS